MKNINVLPTEKPSRIAITDTNVLGMYKVEQIAKYGANQNIYITSDEEIKKGDWYYNSLDNSIRKNNTMNHSYHCKIILTTDQNLIKDGVQSIDDTFLEWFIENPSCEFVEVGKLYKNGYGNWYRNDSHFISSETKYKIIIPKEEPNKTHYLDELPNMDKKVLAKMWESAMPKLEPKQETLEEAANIDSKNHYKDQSDYWAIGFDSFKRGAKWQAERMYSEEEVLDILYKHTEDLLAGKKITLEQWFDQFKKK